MHGWMWMGCPLDASVSCNGSLVVSCDRGRSYRRRLFSAVGVTSAVGLWEDLGTSVKCRYVRFSARAAAVAGDERELECLGSRTASGRQLLHPPSLQGHTTISIRYVGKYLPTCTLGTCIIPYVHTPPQCTSSDDTHVHITNLTETG